MHSVSWCRLQNLMNAWFTRLVVQKAHPDAVCSLEAVEMLKRDFMTMVKAKEDAEKVLTLLIILQMLW